MKLIIICIMLMLFGCNSQPSAIVLSNIQSNSKINLEDITFKTKEKKDKKFRKVEEEYYSGEEYYGGVYFYYDNLGRLIGEESYSSYIEYEYIGDTDKLKTLKSDWYIIEYEYDNLGRLSSEIETYEGDVYSNKKYKYKGDLLIEEQITYPFSNGTEYVHYIYEDGLLMEKYVESINNDTYELYSYLDVYTYGVDMDQPATVEYYYMSNEITSINRNKYKDGLLVKKEFIDFYYGTGEMSNFNYIEYEYDEYDNLIREKFFYQDEFVSETRYIYEEIK